VFSHRFHGWAVIDLTDPHPSSSQLLMRRSCAAGELAFYRCISTGLVSATTLVRVAGSRWQARETFFVPVRADELAQAGRPL